MCVNQATAMVFLQAGEAFEERSIGFTTAAEGEVIVKIEYSTICSSDLHTYTGRRNSPAPSILGHEIVGEIISISETPVTDFDGQPLKTGDQITWAIYAYDKESVMAEKGMPQKSKGLYKYGHHILTETDTLNGGFATHCILKTGTPIFRLPAGITLQEAAPLNCTHATMAGALRTAGEVAGKNVLIVGAGMLGVSACAMAHSMGARKVYAMDVSAERLARSQRFGVSRVFEATASVADIKNSLADEDQVELLIDASGIPSAMEKGLALLAIGGTAVWIGAVFSQALTGVDAEMVVRNLLTIKGLHNYIPEDLRTAIAFMDRYNKHYPFHELVQAEYALHQLTEAFHQANEKSYYRVGVRP